MHLRYRWSFVERSAPPHEQLRYYRNFRGLLGKELAALIGVNHATIVNYENLKSPFDYNNAIKIAEVLQIKKELLFDDFNKFIDYPYHQKLKEVRTELHMTQVEFAAFSYQSFYPLGLGTRNLDTDQRELHIISRSI